MTEGNSKIVLHNESLDSIVELLRYTAGTHEYEDSVWVEDAEKAERLEAIANTIEAQR